MQSVWFRFISSSGNEIDKSSESNYFNKWKVIESYVVDAAESVSENN